MLTTIYTAQHLLHATAGVSLEGHPFVTDEVPARAEVLADALRGARLGPVIAPDDFGLDPILAVHTPDYVNFLRTVHAESAAYFGRAEPVFGETFAPRGAARKPNSFLGLAGYFASAAPSWPAPGRPPTGPRSAPSAPPPASGPASAPPTPSAGRPATTPPPTCTAASAT
jgi:hypothetical protein